MNEPARESGSGKRMTTRMRAAAISMVVAIVLLAAKLAAWRMTGSAAILSDALESIVNVAAASMVLFSVWYGSQPADEDHPYGHGKVEDFSAGVEGALIVLAALGILWAAIPRFFDPRELESIGYGGLLVGLATIANLLLGFYLIRSGRDHHSRALVADGYHVLTDVVSSVGAIGALIAVWITGWLWLDPLLACLIAAHILVAGFRLVRESVGRLMDEADAEALDRVAARLDEFRKNDWIDVHELRAWWSGDTLHVDAHLVLPRYWNIADSHEAADELEDAIGAAVTTESSVVVHVDPCRDRFCLECQVADCQIRVAGPEPRRIWDRTWLVRRLNDEV